MWPDVRSGQILVQIGNRAKLVAISSKLTQIWTASSEFPSFRGKIRRIRPHRARTKFDQIWAERGQSCPGVDRSWLGFVGQTLSKIGRCWPTELADISASVALAERKLGSVSAHIDQVWPNLVRVGPGLAPERPNAARVVRFWADSPPPQHLSIIVRSTCGQPSGNFGASWKLGGSARGNFLGCGASKCSATFGQLHSLGATAGLSLALAIFSQRGRRRHRKAQLRARHHRARPSVRRLAYRDAEDRGARGPERQRGALRGGGALQRRHDVLPEHLLPGRVHADRGQGLHAGSQTSAQSTLCGSLRCSGEALRQFPRRYSKLPPGASNLPSNSSTSPPRCSKLTPNLLKIPNNSFSRLPRPAAVDEPWPNSGRL